MHKDLKLLLNERKQPWFIFFFAVPHLQSRKFVKQVFPLHDNASLRQLSQSWVQAVFSPQPFDRIRKYFGVKIALYFAWLGHYTTALIFPTVFGLVAWKVAGKVKD